MRTVLAIIAILALLRSCSNSTAHQQVYGAQTAELVKSLAVRGWNTGMVDKTTSVAAWRADGTQLNQASLGDPAAFTGSGNMLLGLEGTTIAARYRDDSAARGGPMMLPASPTLPPPGLNPAWTARGSSALILPKASLDSVHVNASLRTQGELNDALLHATVSIVGTHAAVWTLR